MSATTQSTDTEKRPILHYFYQNQGIEVRFRDGDGVFRAVREDETAGEVLESLREVYDFSRLDAAST